MYLFTRQTRLLGGNGTAGIEWAAAMTERVNAITGLGTQLWATVFSPGAGTIGWTSFLPDLATLEAAGDKLQADPGYVEATNEGAALTEGGVDDQLLEILYGEPDPERALNYVSGVQAVCAGGNIVNGATVGIELAQKGEQITGLQTLFVRGATGPYGGVGWLTGHENIASIQAASDAMAADEGWLKLIDEKAGAAYNDDPAVTTSTIYRKMA